MSVHVISDPAAPVILFGAFDRHNFGDLLFPHIAARLLKRQRLRFAGVAERDLRRYGGHRVSALARIAAHDPAVHIVHVGGEVLTCDAWQAAVMLLPPELARRTVDRYGADPDARSAWAHAQLGSPALAPYTTTRDRHPGARVVLYNAVGGVDLDACAPPMRAELLANLRSADQVGVRDRRTQTLLAAAGIASRLMPDPAVLVAELFGTEIGDWGRRGEAARIRRMFPQGYLAVQFSADFGDDATLAQIAAQLDRVVQSTGYGIAFFRAGAAPWHDDLHCYERVAARLRHAAAALFVSLHMWDICALIAGSRGYLGSSLHGRIVAMAFALPRVNLIHPAQGSRPAKQTAFAQTWEEPGMPGGVGVDGIVQGMREALAVEPERLRHIASALAARYRADFDAISAGLG